MGIEHSDQVLTRPEAAQYLKLPLGTLDSLVESGQIPFSRVGTRLVRFSRRRLDDWLAGREGVPYRVRRSQRIGAEAREG